MKQLKKYLKNITVPTQADISLVPTVGSFKLE